MRPQSPAHKIAYPVLVLSLFVLNLFLLFWQASISDWHDFDVFLGGASAALAGKSIYIVVGQYHLPFWYPPWTAWLFIPLALWPRSVALLLYQALSAAAAVLVVHRLSHYYNPKFRLLDEALILGLIVPMSLQLINVGQMDYILLGLVVLAIWGAENDEHLLVGLLYPFLLTKPHLIIPFTVFLFWRLGKRAILVSLASGLGMLVLATILAPTWYLELPRVIRESGGRTMGIAFTTLPSLLGGRENWLGTANVPFTLLLILAALLVLWKVRRLATVPHLSLALALSLLSAPRAYPYDLPLLVPVMVWLTANEFPRKAWIWVAGALIPVLAGYGTDAYLLTVLVCSLGVWKAIAETRRERGILAQHGIGPP